MLESFSKSSGNLAVGVGFILIAMLMRNMTTPDTQEISFQHFKTQLLAKDVVDHIEVANKTTAKVCCIELLSHAVSCSWDVPDSVYIDTQLKHCLCCVISDMLERA